MEEYQTCSFREQSTHDYDANNQWVLNHSHTSLCVVQQMRKKLQNDMPYPAHLHTQRSQNFTTQEHSRRSKSLSIPNILAVEECAFLA